MMAIIYREMQKYIWDCFRIILPAADVVRVFVDKLKLSRIAASPQEHLRLRLILKLSAKPNEGTTSVNDTIDR